jgi:hypothetical protein
LPPISRLTPGQAAPLYFWLHSKSSRNWSRSNRTAT